MSFQHKATLNISNFEKCSQLRLTSQLAEANLSNKDGVTLTVDGIRDHNSLQYKVIQRRDGNFVWFNLLKFNELSLFEESCQYTDFSTLDKFVEEFNNNSQMICLLNREQTVDNIPSFIDCYSKNKQQFKVLFKEVLESLYIEKHARVSFIRDEISLIESANDQNSFSDEKLTDLKNLLTVLKEELEKQQASIAFEQAEKNSMLQIEISWMICRDFTKNYTDDLITRFNEEKSLFEESFKCNFASAEKSLIKARDSLLSRKIKQELTETESSLLKMIKSKFPENDDEYSVKLKFPENDDEYSVKSKFPENDDEYSVKLVSPEHDCKCLSEPVSPEKQIKYLFEAASLSKLWAESVQYAINFSSDTELNLIGNELEKMNPLHLGFLIGVITGSDKSAMDKYDYDALNKIRPRLESIIMSHFKKRDFDKLADICIFSDWAVPEIVQDLKSRLEKKNFWQPMLKSAQAYNDYLEEGYEQSQTDFQRAPNNHPGKSVLTGLFLY